MACGHVSNAVDEQGKPCCLICLGLKPGATKVVREVEGTDGLKGRKAKCPYCGKTTNSNWSLPFFEYKPNEEFDEYYDGCFGWD